MLKGQVILRLKFLCNGLRRDHSSCSSLRITIFRRLTFTIVFFKCNAQQSKADVSYIYSTRTGAGDVLWKSISSCMYQMKRNLANVIHTVCK